MITVSIVYRCLFTIVLCLLNLAQWVQRTLVNIISRRRYIIRVNIDVTRNDFDENLSTDKLQFNKSTNVVAIIINETIPDEDLYKFIGNTIRFFRRFQVQHLIIYDYQGYIKVHETAILDYVHAYDKKSLCRQRTIVLFSCFAYLFQRKRLCHCRIYIFFR